MRHLLLITMLLLPGLAACATAPDRQGPFAGPFAGVTLGGGTGNAGPRQP